MEKFLESSNIFTMAIKRNTILPYVVLLCVLILVFLAACSPKTEFDVSLNQSEILISKGRQDTRTYKFVELKNGLSVLLVNDPDADKAAATLDVHIGALADPRDREGLSHFLEHMLFLGTEKYPEPGEYARFINSNGGSKNASTAMEHTTYYFEIANAQLEPALDRFSRFFIDPLFLPEFVDKERLAVDSEFSLRVKDDTRRYREAIKQTTNPDHPFSQFTVGNLETLSDTPTSTILEDVEAHFSQYYSADIMTLVIVGNHPVEDLENWAETKFSEIKRLENAPVLARPKPFLPEQTGVKIFINTLKDDKSVRLVFALPPAQDYYLQKPVEYIVEQLRYKGPGGFYDGMNQNGQVSYYGVTSWGPKDFTQLQINIGLSDKGYANIDEIIADFFSYLELIKVEGVSKTRFREISEIKNLDFEFKDRARVSQFARTSARRLQEFPPQHVLDLDRTFIEYDPALIKRFLSYITPEKSRVIIGGPDIRSDQSEERYGGAYSIEALPSDLIDDWKPASGKSKYSLPQSNPYMPKEFDLIDAPKNTMPKTIFERPGLELLLANGDNFGLPKVSLKSRIYSSKAYESVEHNVTMTIHRLLISDTMRSESYFAGQAGLDFSLRNSSRSLNIDLTGYSDQIGRFLSDTLVKIDPKNFTEEQFERLKSTYIKRIQDRKKNSPIQQVFGAMRIESDKFTIPDSRKLSAVKALSFDRFMQLTVELQEQVKIEALLTGNIDQKEGRKIGKILYSHFEKALTPDGKLKFEETKLPAGGMNILEIPVSHKDSAIAVILQGESESYDEVAKYYITRHLLGSRFFQSLRTEQQLGYVVSMSNYSFDLTPALLMSVQSTGRHPSLLLEKIKTFLDEQTDYLNELSDEDYQNQIDGLISNTLKRPDNVSSLGGRYYLEIVRGKLDFNRREKIAEAIRKTSLADINVFYANHIIGPSKRQAVVWSVADDTRLNSNFEREGYKICKVSKCLTANLRKNVGKE